MNAEKNEFIKLAIEYSAKNLNGKDGGPFGAVIIKNGVVIATASNQVKAMKDPTAHAEIQAIRQACQTLDTYDLSGCEIYTSCEPCPMCLGAIYWSGIRNVYYAADRFDARQAGFDDQLIYDELKKPSSERFVKLLQLDKKDGQEVFLKWKKQPPQE